MILVNVLEGMILSPGCVVISVLKIKLDSSTGHQCFKAQTKLDCLTD